jgi:transposase-like protein
MTHISHCPFCGAEFERASAQSDSRITTGYLCTDCDEVFEVQVNRYPRTASTYD